ncbi:MAG: ATP-binding cassette domain-containing protein, partial [Nocardiaceae bacterium]|nr:ATP-binding cassette domain-containing protein [Nocardiaceae bacterium]
MASLLERSRSLFGHADDVPAAAGSGAVTMRATDIRVERGGRTVLDHVNITVRAGEVLALVGPNGAGKSTLLAALSGDQPVASGVVELDGKPLTDWSPSEMARRRAVLPQQHTVGFSFTARQVVRMGRAPWQRTPLAADDDKLIDHCLDVCDVQHLADRPFSVLSGGERARVALARVLAQSTETVLLD